MNKKWMLLSVFIGALFLFYLVPVNAQIVSESYGVLRGDGFIRTDYSLGGGIDWQEVINLDQASWPRYVQTYNIGVGIYSDNYQNKWSILTRSIFPFNTTVIPENAIIESAKLHIFVGTKEDNGLNADLDWNIYAANPATTSSLIETDFGKFGAEAFSTAKTWDETEQYSEQVFDLNEAGIAHINKGGFTSFGVRNATYDAGGVEPNWVADKRAYINFYYSDHEDETKHAYLEVEYKFEEVKAGLTLGIYGDSDWTKRQNIVISSENVFGEDVLEDFPLLLTEHSFDSSVFSEVKENGCDIRFSKNRDLNNPQEIPFEIAVFDAVDQVAQIWVKTDLKPYEDNTIWMWWGNNEAECYEDEFGAENVWREEYRGVWHLNEESWTRYDSTSNNNDLTDRNTVDAERDIFFWGNIKL